MTGDLSTSGLPARGGASGDGARPGADQPADNPATQFQRLVPMPTWSNSVQLPPGPSSAE